MSCVSAACSPARTAEPCCPQVLKTSAMKQDASFPVRKRLTSANSVAALIPDNASIFINIGTTTEAVAQALLQHHGLMVITNNLNVASLMRGYSQIEVVVAGGVLRHADGGIVGEAAVDFMRQFKVDFAVIGASAIDPDGSLLDYDYREVKVTKTIMENARHVILAADSTKFERTAPVRVGHLSQVTTLVTDRCPSPNSQRLQKTQIRS
jgi:DeoR family glycerol-3-phosphate regulon repressor